MIEHRGLLDLREGDHATIAAVEGVRSGSKRLADLGFVRGAKITMVRPGRPCIIRIDGRCIGLGVGHQRNIQLLAG